MSEQGDWKATLPEDLRSSPVLEKYQSVEDVVKGLVNAQELIGRKGIIPPGENATDEDVQRFVEQLEPHKDTVLKRFLEIPDSPDKYDLGEIKPPEGLELSEDYIANFKKVAHEAGIPPKQAAKVMEWITKTAEERVKAALEQAEQARQETEAQLKKEWGDKFDEKVKKAQAIAKIGGEEFVQYLEETGLGNHPALIKAFVAIAEKLSEDDLVSGETPPGYGETLTEEKLRQMMRDPRYYDPVKRDMEYVRKVEEGWKKIYPGTAQLAPIDRRRPA